MNLQVIASPGGEILWVSGALPGSVHDKRVEWIWGVLDELEKAALVALADKGYQAAAGRRSRTRAETSRNPKRGQPRPREAPRPRRKGKRAAKDLEDPHQAPLLPLARREAGQGHPRIATPRGITRMEKVHCSPISDRALRLPDESRKPTGHPDAVVLTESSRSYHGLSCRSAALPRRNTASLLRSQSRHPRGNKLGQR